MAGIEIIRQIYEILIVVSSVLFDTDEKHPHADIPLHFCRLATCVATTLACSTARLP